MLDKDNLSVYNNPRRLGKTWENTREKFVEKI